MTQQNKCLISPGSGKTVNWGRSKPLSHFFWTFPPLILSSIQNVKLILPNAVKFNSDEIPIPHPLIGFLTRNTTQIPASATLLTSQKVFPSPPYPPTTRVRCPVIFFTFFSNTSSGRTKCSAEQSLCWKKACNICCTLFNNRNFQVSKRIGNFPIIRIFTVTLAQFFCSVLI